MDLGLAVEKWDKWPKEGKKWPKRLKNPGFGAFPFFGHFSPGFGGGKIRGFEKGLAGGGLATNKPSKRAKKGSPEMCPPSPKGA